MSLVRSLSKRANGRIGQSIVRHDAHIIWYHVHAPEDDPAWSLGHSKIMILMRQVNLSHNQGAFQARFAPTGKGRWACRLALIVVHFKPHAVLDFVICKQRCVGQGAYVSVLTWKQVCSWACLFALIRNKCLQQPSGYRANGRLEGLAALEWDTRRGTEQRKGGVLSSSCAGGHLTGLDFFLIVSYK